MIKINLAVLLAERGVKITEVAKQTGISRTTLTALYYNHSKGIQWDTLDVLCQYLKVKPNDLILHESFSYNFEVLDIQKKSDSCYNNWEEINLSYKVTYQNTSLNGTLMLMSVIGDTGSSFDVSGTLDPQLKELLSKIPITVRSEFENELAQEIKFYRSSEPAFAEMEIALFIS